MAKNRVNVLPFGCDTCAKSFSSAKELTKHYEEKHPDMIEKVIMPI
jgi:hypothetical protein